MEQTKICTKCKQELPATREYFYYDKKKTDGLFNACIECSKNIRKQSRLRKLSENPNYDKDCHYRYKDKRNKCSRDWFKNNREYAIEKHKQWLATEKGQKLLKYYKIKDTQRRRTIAKKVINDLTIDQWNRCLEEFKFCCAYCGKKLVQITIDHFIPLSNNGELSVWNVLPCCFSCNSSKNNKDFFEWYSKQSFYNKLREKKILKYLNYTKDKFQILELIG